MTKNRLVYAALAVAGLLFASLPAGAEDAISHPATKPIGPTKNEMVPSLAVLNSKGATLTGQQTDADRRLAQLHRLRRPSRARGGARADLALHQGMGRRQ